MVEKTNTIVVGGGQAGIATSEHLTALGIPHIVLERSRIAERWRTQRWDSMVCNGPAWHDRFPGLTFEGQSPEAFVHKEDVAKYLEDYARKFDAPIRTGVEVQKVERNQGKPGYTVHTSDGAFEALNIVAATGPFQKPVIPVIAPKSDNIYQIHSAEYKNPEQLKEGAVLVIGAGSSGVQIADELQRSGRKVFLSVGPHHRPPRRYRGRDFCWWLGVLRQWDDQDVKPGFEHVTIAVSGARGGETIDFRALGNQGIVLLGTTQSFVNGTVHFADDLIKNVENGDQNYLNLLDEADRYVAANGLDLPEEPEARQFPESPDCLKSPISHIDLAKENITNIIWATGFSQDYSWLEVDTFDENGKPLHQRGISRQPGVYFVGLPWLSRRGSSFIWGVWHDAKYIADHIATIDKYLEYEPEHT